MAVVRRFPGMGMVFSSRFGRKVAFLFLNYFPVFLVKEIGVKPIALLEHGVFFFL
jgi:hypothetical protein